LSSGQCFLFAGTGCVHKVSIIPLHLVFLERAKAVVAFGLQRNAAFQLWNVEGANPGRSLAGVECHSGTSRGSDTFLLDNLSPLECWRGLGRRRRWAYGRSAGLGQVRGSLLWSQSLGC
jgi:hypothetical protein